MFNVTGSHNNDANIGIYSFVLYKTVRTKDKGVIFISYHLHSLKDPLLTADSKCK